MGWGDHGVPDVDAAMARLLLDHIEDGWNSRSADRLVQLYDEHAVLIYAGDQVAEGVDEIGEWISAAHARRNDIEIRQRLRAWNDDVVCTEYVSRFADASGDDHVVAGAELFFLKPRAVQQHGPQSHDMPRIVRQHIYPATPGDGTDLVTNPPPEYGATPIEDGAPTTREQEPRDG